MLQPLYQSIHILFCGVIRETDPQGSVLLGLGQLQRTKHMTGLPPMADWTKDPDGDRKIDISDVLSGTVHVYAKSGSALEDFDAKRFVLFKKRRESFCGKRDVWHDVEH